MHRRNGAAFIVCFALAAFTASTTPAQDLRTAQQAASELFAQAERVVAPYGAATVALLDGRTAYTWNDDGIGWQVEGKTLFTYDDIYRTEGVDYVWTGTDFEPSVRREYSHDALNNVTATYQWDASVGDYVPVDKTDFTYVFHLLTGEKFVVDRIYSVWDGSAYVNEERVTYTFGDELVYSSSQTDTWNGISWEPAEREIITEEDAGVVYVVQEWQSGAWINSQRVIYGFATRKALYDELRSILASAQDYENAIYLLQLMPTSRSETWNGTEWVPAGRQSVYYDLFTGRKIQKDYEEFADGEWVVPIRIGFEYGDDGILSGATWQINDGEGGFATVLREQYTWNQRGQVTSIEATVDFGAGLSGSSRLDYAWRYTATGTENEEVPAAFELEPAYPNPFNPSTRMTYRVAHAGHVSIRVFDSLGRHVATLVDGLQPAGSYDLTIDLAALPSGVYLVRLETAHGRAIRSVTLLK